MRVSTSDKEFRNPLFKKLGELSAKLVKEWDKRDAEEKKNKESVLRTKDKDYDENTMRKTLDYADTFSEMIGE